jgi:Dual specificity phosphatase, catalytic domain
MLSEFVNTTCEHPLRPQTVPTRFVNDLGLKNSEGFSDITSVLAVGKSEPHGGPTMKQLKEDYGVGVVVDLVLRQGESGEAQRADLTYVGKKLPMVPTPIMLESLSRTIDQEISAGRKVYVHCHEGKFRAPTVAVAYLVFKGVSVDEAVKHVRSRRDSSLPGLEESKKLLPALRLFESRIRKQSSSKQSKIESPHKL